jgi:hypothetical protein
MKKFGYQMTINTALPTYQALEKKFKWMQHQIYQYLVLLLLILKKKTMQKIDIGLAASSFTLIL